tara:strand:- start:8932 stop:9939 length:1008 start_codon:yes stop_codon:yes gene_type:complete
LANQRFINAIKLTEQNVPPIWFMRQAGRYHKHYQTLKKKYSFEELCKTPELAAEVALGPVEEFDFDIAILFSDILFILEALGMNLKFNPGPIFEEELNKDNFQKYQNIEKAINFLEFQKKALKKTRDKLPEDKSIIGFVGGPWTILNYAMGKKNLIGLNENTFSLIFLKKTLIPLIKKNIQLQIQGGAEVVMILDSALGNIGEKNFEIYYSLLKSEFSESKQDKIAYYAKGINNQLYNKLIDLEFSGLGCDSSINLQNLLKNNQNKFIQGNFDENKMLFNRDDLKKELDIFCNQLLKLTSKERRGWICGLGHGINKNTNEENVHLFIKTIRERFA